jgi:hypothetical protein
MVVQIKTLIGGCMPVGENGGKGYKDWNAIHLAKHPGGRPKTTLAKLPENWKEKMIELGNEGASQYAIMSSFMLGHSAFKTLLDNSEEFRNYYEMFQILSRDWWEKAGNKLTNGEYDKGKPAAWTFAMANRFGCRAKVEISGNQENPLNINMSVAKRNLSKQELVEELKNRGLPTNIFGEDDLDVD